MYIWHTCNNWSLMCVGVHKEKIFRCASQEVLLLRSDFEHLLANHSNHANMILLAFLNIIV